MPRPAVLPHRSASSLRHHDAQAKLVPTEFGKDVMDNPVLVEVTRGALVESVHRGALAVSDARGRLRLKLGDVERPIFPRSALKPVQAVPLIESGAADAF